MLLIQMTGLSGAGKTTLAQETARQLIERGYKVELIDGDEYRQHLCRDLGFSKADRLENIRRLGFVGLTLARQEVITILAAINPYEEGRQALKHQSERTLTVFVDCPLEVLEQRDVKGLYRRARLPKGHPDQVEHFTGISDPYEAPLAPDLTIYSHLESAAVSAEKIVGFILAKLQTVLQPEGRVEKRLPRALFIGRWQPFHNGHKWLINRALEKGAPVLIGVRDLPCDDQNPFSTAQTMEMIRRIYRDQPVEVLPLPDIESVNYGRDVGYHINCHEPPADVHAISATFIREGLRRGDPAWRQYVDESIHDYIVHCLAAPE